MKWWGRGFDAEEIADQWRASPPLGCQCLFPTLIIPSNATDTTFCRKLEEFFDEIEAEAVTSP
jgi:hypothetical protein